MTRAIVAAIFLGLLAGCGGTATHPAGGKPPTPPAHQQPHFSATLLRSASGAPAGVEATWPAVAIANLAGYRLYRSATAIADSSLGDNSLWVQAGLIAPSGGATETFDDLFPVSVGQVWHYRVSAVDADGDESDLSPESALTISNFQITKLDTLTGGVGDSVVIEGLDLGSYDAATDTVSFRGVTFDPANGMVPALIPAVVSSWTYTTITCVVPIGATTGKVQVSISGLSQDTPEVFTNTDPYINSVAPLSGFNDGPVTVTGANFGAAQDATHNLVFDGNPLAAADYVSYADTQIVFHPKGGSAYGSPLDVHVQVNARSSNTFTFQVIDRPPVAALTANPTSGSTPLTVDFDASASSDPDGDAPLHYTWDFDGDGTDDFDSGTTATAAHVYATAGVFNARVTVTDGHGGSAAFSVPVTVTLSPLTIVDNGSDPAGDYYQKSNKVTLRYVLGGGEPVYSIDWNLIDENGTATLLGTDTGLSLGAGSHDFPIDSTTDVPTAGSGKLPLGLWQIQAVTHDGGAANDPDPSLTWPPKNPDGSQAYFHVWRYNVLVVVDSQGDGKGVESRPIQTLLSGLGYQVALKSSNAIKGSDFTGVHATIWAAEGAHGSDQSPYEWLGVNDLALIKPYVDGGGTFIMLGPPANPAIAGNPFPQDAAFNGNYQPYASVSQQTDKSGQKWTCQDFMLQHDYLCNDFVLGPAPQFYGRDDTSVNPLFAGSTPEASASIAPTSDYCVGAVRLPTTGGAVYLGMFQFSKASTFDPNTITPAQFLDNIVAGSIGTH